MKLLILIFLLSNILLAGKIELEILGSGGPEIDGRASTSYLLWIDDEAKLIVDMGSGSLLRFEQSHAKIETLEAVVLTHLHIDHSVDLPAFIKAGYFSKRRQSLDIIAPYGNNSFPSINEFLVGLFGEHGVYRYMQDVLTPQSDSFQIIPIEIDSDTPVTKQYKSFTLTLINVHHGSVPALALAIFVDGKKIVISGDTDDRNKNLEKLAKNADLFIAHHAVPEHANNFAKTLHMSPSIIAKVAHISNVKQVVLTHRMNRTFFKEEKSLKIIKRSYKGKVIFAEDRMKIKL
ncbi:MAG: MBL fold metallo-hydrolase [Sulfurimonas sp.]